jgi:5-methylcytosine-specific restriction enzyme subunit McrC
MSPVTVFEHEVLPVGAGVTSAEKNALERLNGSLGIEVCKVGWREVRATSYVGVVQLPNRVIQILPKVYRDVEKREEEATRNLLFFLHYTRKLEVSETEISELMEQKAPLSEVLYWIFARRLWDAVRREILRGYVSMEARLSVLKGRWLLTRQVRRAEGWRKDLFDVAYDEFTEDNLPNRLLKAAMERLTRCARWPETLRILTQTRAVFDEVGEIVPRVEDFLKADQWMLGYRRRAGAGRVYRPLLNTARMFLVGASTRLSQGRFESFAYVFDMNELFEEFIAEFIRRELREVWEGRGWRVQPQSATRALLQDSAGRKAFWLKPDVRFESSARRTELILDTKYKVLDVGAAKLDVAQPDAYQMFAYRQRYECPRVVLVYPDAGEPVPQRWRSEENGPAWLEVRTVNLRRDFSEKAERDRLRKALGEILTDAYPVASGVTMSFKGT